MKLQTSFTIINHIGLDGVKAKVLQLSLHWGKRNNGSEHRLDEEQFSAESHLVTTYGENKLVQVKQVSTKQIKLVPTK